MSTLLEFPAQQVSKNSATETGTHSSRQLADSICLVLRIQPGDSLVAIWGHAGDKTNCDAIWRWVTAHQASHECAGFTMTDWAHALKLALMDLQDQLE